LLPGFDLTGRCALVTGSTRGIGLAIAEHLAAAGARLVISGRKAETCDAVAQALRDAGREAVGVPCNVAEKEQVLALADAARDAFGGVDILVSNAAVNAYFGPLAALDEAVWDNAMRANVKSGWWLSNALAPQMAARGGGAIVFVSSIAALYGTRNLGLYAITKAAENALVRNLAVEWGTADIRVNAIAPGVIKTSFSRALWDNPAYAQAYVESVPLRRIGHVDDVAGLALLLSSSAGRFITGQTILVDGGVSIADKG
jgi:NAD(P)-dependent dehydrogenase (short-subunit alcohol dehydrogenase family)